MDSTKHFCFSRPSAIDGLYREELFDENGGVIRILFRKKAAALHSLPLRPRSPLPPNAERTTFFCIESIEGATLGPVCEFHSFPPGMKVSSEPRSCLNSLDLAAVHTNRSARHPLRRWGHEIAQQIGDFLRLSKAADSRFLREPLDCVFHGEMVRRRPLFEERPPASCHHSAWHDAVDLHSIFDSLLCEGFGECVDGRIDRRDCCKSRFGIEGCASRHQHHRPARGFQRIPSLYGQPTRAVQLKRHPVIPLRVRHLEQINLWHCTRNVEQGVDPAKAFEGR